MRDLAGSSDTAIDPVRKMALADRRMR